MNLKASSVEGNMSHMLLEKDTMYSAKEKPWHYDEHPNQVAVTDEILTMEKALPISGLTWLVESKPVFVDGKEVQGYKANVSDDEVLGIVSDRYKIVQNADAFSFVDHLLANPEQVKFETAGSLFNRRKVWILARMPDSLILGDTVENYLYFTNGHDGKNAISVGLTNVRIVCNNTLQLATASARRTWSTKHMGNIEAKKHEAARTLELASSYLSAMAEKAETYQQTFLSKEAFNEFVEMVFPLPDADMSSIQEKRALAFRNGFIDIYNEKPDIENFRGTAWGAYLALTDYISHVEPVRLTKTYKEKRWDSFMVGNSMLESGQKALETVLSL